MPLRLTDRQLREILNASVPLPPDKRGLLLERVAARLKLDGVRGGPSDAAVAAALQDALVGLVHEPAL